MLGLPCGSGWPIGTLLWLATLGAGTSEPGACVKPRALGFGAGVGTHEASAAAAIVRSVMCWVFINRSMIGNDALAFVAIDYSELLYGQIKFWLSRNEIVIFR